MNSRKRLILIPTYNEIENSERLCREILILKLSQTDILFVDDNSPDGTGELLEKISKNNRKVKVIHRSGKKGIGSAHLEGINWAYKHGYRELITMDCDFTHSPSYIPKIINTSDNYDIVVGSRYLEKKSLVGWNFYRKVLTLAGHMTTKLLLGMKYDASGAFRLYRLDRIPRKIFKLVDSKGYSFFLESLYILNLNGFKISEFPIKLPARTYGSSKMKPADIFTSVNRIISLYLRSITDRSSLRI
jgi:dolichol-phosphate mannosyltransferase